MVARPDSGIPRDAATIRELCRGPSETQSHGQLERARTTRTEQLRVARGRLPEGGTCEIVTITCKVRGIVKVEHLTDQHQTPPLAKDERPAQPQIERLKTVIE
jgi:hypothetical protein